MMDTYSFLRQLADSWVLLAMFGFFLSVILWAFRPGGSAIYDEIAQIPLRDEAPLAPPLDSNDAENTGRSTTKGAPHVEA
jgi:cytochrome c oxidase cbb3-type subunit 4